MKITGKITPVIKSLVFWKIVNFLLKLTIFQRSGPKFCIFTTVFFNFSIQNTISLKVTFPAVYICNLNQITKTFLKNIATDDESELTGRVILSQFRGKMDIYVIKINVDQIVAKLKNCTSIDLQSKHSADIQIPRITYF